MADETAITSESRSDVRLSPGCLKVKGYCCINVGAIIPVAGEVWVAAL